MNTEQDKTIEKIRALLSSLMSVSDRYAQQFGERPKVLFANEAWRKSFEEEVFAYGIFKNSEAQTSNLVGKDRARINGHTVIFGEAHPGSCPNPIIVASYSLQP